MKTSVPKESENITKLRELTENITKENKDDYKIIVKNLKTIIDEGKNAIDNSDSDLSKIKCYESMCETITKLLTSVKSI